MAIALKPFENTFDFLKLTITEPVPVFSPGQLAALTQLAAHLNTLDSLEEFSEVVGNELPAALNLAELVCLLPDHQGNLRSLRKDEQSTPTSTGEFCLEIKGPLATRLAAAKRPIWLSELELTAPPELSSELAWLIAAKFDFILSLKNTGLVGIIAGKLSAGFSPACLPLELTATLLNLAIQNILLRQANCRRLTQVAVADRHHLELLNRRQLSAREEERKHLSRELHDGVVQDLLLMLNRLEHWPEGERPKQIEELQAHTRRALDTVRQICRNLRPRLLDLSLSFSINDLVRRFQKENPSPKLVLRIEGKELPSNEAARLTIYRVAQEALHNCLKHAEAEQVYILLAFHAATENHSAQIEIVIKDNGRGFVPPADIHDLFKQDRLGLVGMYERVTGVGGRFWLSSVVGKGTRIVARIPLPTPPAPLD